MLLTCKQLLELLTICRHPLLLVFSASDWFCSEVAALFFSYGSLNHRHKLPNASPPPIYECASLWVAAWTGQLRRSCELAAAAASSLPCRIMPCLRSLATLPSTSTPGSRPMPKRHLSRSTTGCALNNPQNLQNPTTNPTVNSFPTPA